MNEKRLIGILFDLARKQNWLHGKDDRIAALFELCEDEKQIKLVRTLLENFHYFDAERMQECLAKLAEYIVKEPHFDAGTAHIVASAFDRNADSSHAILHMLKPSLATYKAVHTRCSANLGISVRKIEELPNIFIVDEFSGTGNTIINSVTWLKRNLNDKLKQNNIGRDFKFTIRVGLLAAMEPALTKIKDAGIEAFAAHVMPKAISGSPELHDVPASLEHMRVIEGKLDQNRMNPFPSLGYGEAEATYAAENYNIPNSVFPVFWWRHLMSGKPYRPLFDRYEKNYSEQ